jgi:hypothetical protein
MSTRLNAAATQNVNRAGDRLREFGDTIDIMIAAIKRKATAARPLREPRRLLDSIPCRVNDK